jgi:lysine 2,3-aminomutase
MTNDWHASLSESVTTISQLSEFFNFKTFSLQPVIERYPLRITRYYLDLIKEEGDPVWRQCIPDILEIADSEDVPDPLNECGLSPVPGLIHRYPDRVVLLVSNECAVYCRFCMRKRGVGCRNGGMITAKLLDAIDYLRETRVIRDVLLSGGDPFLLEDDQIEEILEQLRRIQHIEIIRIGTRTPVTLPERITPKLCGVLKRYHPLYINTHFNHPLEITEVSRRACSLLSDAGIPLGNQTVLLKGVNDTPAVMSDLVRSLLCMRVKPYYLHQMDMVKGTAHFRTSVATGLGIMESLRGHVSGLAVPYYVIDLPGGHGKVPLLPDICRLERRGYNLRAYTGETVEYPDL